VTISYLLGKFLSLGVLFCPQNLLRIANRLSLVSAEHEIRCYGILCPLSPAPVLRGAALPFRSLFAGPLSKDGFSREIPQCSTSDLFPEFPCDSELITVDALSREKICVLRCSGCDTEFTCTPECEWVTVVYPGMKSDLEIG
jgi:hypothetical protein